MTMNARIRLGLAVAAALVAAMATVGVAGAAPEPTVVKVATAAPRTPGQGYSISAQVTTAAGKPVNSVTLSFYIAVDLFGPRQMLAGTATTDGQGRASIRYTPSWEGQHDVVVKFAGSPSFGATEGKGSFMSAVAIAPHENERLPLAGFSDRLPLAVGAVVLGVWLAIIFALVSAVLAALGTRGHGRVMEAVPQRTVQEVP